MIPRALYRAIADVVSLIPLGYVDGKLVLHRATTEADLVEWTKKVYVLQQAFRDVEEE